MSDLFTIRTDRGGREATIEDIAATFDCNRTKAVLKACRHTEMDIRNKQRAIEYLEANVPGQHARHVAELLSTRHVAVEYETKVQVAPDTD